MPATAAELGQGIAEMYSRRSSANLVDMASDDFVFWDNIEARDKPLNVIAAEFDLYIDQFKSVDVAILRLEELSDGFLQQYVVRAMLPDGQPTPDHHVCLIVKTRGGKVVRIDEYCA